MSNLYKTFIKLMPKQRFSARMSGCLSRCARHSDAAPFVQTAFPKPTVRHSKQL
ncbi:hypothetical protein NEILACOT_03685 [Neisseria lactamica ATCC 23970]|uniref:Uncharacterized protein n=1 Tax=Neisseria lactamica ATCC 23970 TaxID=546265 RepID=D0W832_NEILA|nr:hypothetical protein NEILACOT_03685 [Neisseria lactamica ATCC 23970]